MKQIVLTVTNDLSFDQRMHRICGSLASAGYGVTLIGRKLPASLPLKKYSFNQKRLRCFFKKGSLFYAEYNFRLFWYLLFKKADVICAIDLDTILPCYFVSKIKGIKRVYDAHEYFTELKEVRTRKHIKAFWEGIEKLCIPSFKYGYTVSQGLADAFHEEYGSEYEVIRNMPVLKDIPGGIISKKELYYQGAVNEGRGFEQLIPAMKKIPYKLVICGDGNYMDQLKDLIQLHNVSGKIELKGMIEPGDLDHFALSASLGIGLAESEGLNQFMALPNKFFDYMHAGLPQIAMNFPEYRKINESYRVAILIDSLQHEKISDTINSILQNEALLDELKKNCLEARKIFCWQQEEKKLIEFYQRVINE